MKKKYGTAVAAFTAIAVFLSSASSHANTSPSESAGESASQTFSHTVEPSEIPAISEENVKPIAATVEIDYREDAPLDELVESVNVTMSVSGEVIHKDLTAENLTLRGGEEFSIELTDRAEGTELALGPGKAVPTFLPAAWYLALLVKIGIRALIKKVGKAKIRKAATAYLMKDKGVQWNKILAKKHRWESVGGTSKKKVANLMGRAMAEGKHVPEGKGAVKVTWKYRGETITVTYHKSSGKIGNGWVNRK